jgi:hypothetical protein
MLFEMVNFFLIYIALAELDGVPLPIEFAHAFAMSLPGVTARAARSVGTVNGVHSWFRPTRGWSDDQLGLPRPRGFGRARGAFVHAADDGTISISPFAINYLCSLNVNFMVSCSKGPLEYILCSGSGEPHALPVP